MIDAIITTRKIKLKHNNFTIRSADKLHISPPDKSKDQMFFTMQKIKMELPLVIVKGVTSIKRAVISKQEKNDNLF